MAKAAVVPIFSGLGGEHRRAEQAEGQGQCFDWVGEQGLFHDGFQSGVGVQ
jgi:hypothetical protein